MPDPIQCDSRSPAALASMPEDPETLICSAAPSSTSQTPAPRAGQEPAPLARGAARLVEEYTAKPPRDAKDCGTKALIAADACLTAAAAVLERKSGGPASGMLAYPKIVLCGVKALAAYECYTDNSVR